MDNKEKFYITTAIAYAYQKPHFGNTYEAIMSDVYARYKKQQGYDVYFLTGTDEHGQKIQNAAEKAGIEPQTYVDKVAGEVKEVWDTMDVSYDQFIRTTDPKHVRSVQSAFEKLIKKGDIYKSEYEGWYCIADESFYTDSQLIDGKCPDCGGEVTKAKEEAYFFKCSNYTDRLIEYFESNRDFIQPESRRNEMINNFLKPGLQDLCVSRTSFTWGIQVPSNPKHVIYVWFDALMNYITALGYDPDLEEQSDLFKKNWPCDVHIIGKDIMRFHSIYWPMFLMALDLPLPHKIFGHPWFLFGKDKMSKHIGNVIYADDLAKTFGTDGVRYYAIAEMPYANDGSITYESFISRYNTDLANNLGNLVKRTLSMNTKYFNGVVQNSNCEDEKDSELKSTVETCARKFSANMESFHFADAVSNATELLSRTNKYIDETVPWVLAKNNDDLRLGTVLYNLLESVRIAAILLLPIIPSTSTTILDSLNTSKRDYSTIKVFGGLETGIVNKEAPTLFARIDAEAFLGAQQKNTKPADEQFDFSKVDSLEEGIISIDDFMKADLRAGKIIECETVEKSKKLLKLTVDLGYKKCQIVSGIAKFYKPSELVGKIIVVVSNLKPAVLCGEESEGMILASGKDTVRVVFLTNDTPLGDRIR